ncbi:MAG TPA: EamA family transporter [Actinomycetota bacterium]|nr:EamA family transporter [Actinomycetota bacterium]
MAVFLALCAAVAYGAGDFAGGIAARRISVLAVVIGSQAIGLVIFVALVPVMGAPSTGGLAWGAAAGAFGGIGVTLLYRGLAVGRMSVVAPITGVGAALLPVTWDLARGARPGLVAIPGAMLALVAIVLVSAVDDAGTEQGVRWSKQPGVGLAIGAGVAFGAWFITLAGAPGDSGLWPVLGTRIASLTLLGIVASIRRTPLMQVRSAPLLVGAAGILDILANGLYLLATRRGLLAIVAVVTALYPAATVLLARLVLKEQFGVRQRAGMLAAAAGVALLSLA